MHFTTFEFPQKNGLYLKQWLSAVTTHIRSVSDARRHAGCPILSAFTVPELLFSAIDLRKQTNLV